MEIRKPQLAPKLSVLPMKEPKICRQAICHPHEVGPLCEVISYYTHQSHEDSPDFF